MEENAALLAGRMESNDRIMVAEAETFIVLESFAVFGLVSLL